MADRLNLTRGAILSGRVPRGQYTVSVADERTRCRNWPAIARAVFSEELNPHDSAAAIAAGGGIAEVHAAAWDRAAARLRANNLHAAADAAEETTR